MGESSWSLPSPTGVQVRGLHPLGQNRQAIRTGGRSSTVAAPRARAAGRMASRNGKATVAPAPRSTVLRVIGRFFGLITGPPRGSSTPVLEREALRDRDDQRRRPVVVRLQPGHDL